MSNLIKVGSDFYILASSLASKRVTRVLANGEGFAIFEVGGDIFESPLEPLGFFFRDTRYLSRFQLRLADEYPHFLNSFISADNAQLRVNLTNPDLRSNLDRDVIRLGRNSIQIERSYVLWGRQLFHRIAIRSFASEQVDIGLRLELRADFADLFEVRGVTRERKGQLVDPVVTRSTILYCYSGLDGVQRTTHVHFESPPDDLGGESARYDLQLKPGERKVLQITITAAEDKATIPGPRSFVDALGERHAEIAALDAHYARISTNNELMNAWLADSHADLTTITRKSEAGLTVNAGIPWFATLFGRDSILTALFVLPFNPGLAVGTLRTLAALQGTDVNQQRDEQPGKIVHEIRQCEMALTGEVPFGRYYGGIDQTPLFLLLYARYVASTADLALARELWPNVERALDWVERWGDQDGDLYVEYMRETPRGLTNQGWKDSFDAIAHADGTLAHPPIALCEVQAYVYAAYSALAGIALRLGHISQSTRLIERAEELKKNFLRDFWLDKERTVALALDGEKRPCRVMSSNAAHCFGMLDEGRARALAERLSAEEMFSGWGLRTLSSAERRYNPMSYHNGSIWPHDNAMAVWGLARSHLLDGTLKIVTGLFDAATYFRGSLPELFCGFAREARISPVPYPVACHPQAWSAASVFLAVQAMLGITIDGFGQRLRLDSPLLPDWLQWLKVEDLQVGDGQVSLLARRAPNTADAHVEILERRGVVSIEIHK